MVLFTHGEMVVYLLDEEHNYEADGMPSTYTRRKLYKHLGVCLNAFQKDRQLHRYYKISY